MSTTAVRLGRLLSGRDRGTGALSYQADDYRRRAEECVRLANEAKDDLIQRDLLMLRQTYLQIADRLSKLEKEPNAS